eukprot:g3715.t1
MFPLYSWRRYVDNGRMGRYDDCTNHAVDSGTYRGAKYSTPNSVRAIATSAHPQPRQSNHLLVCGGLAGVCAKSAVSPLERIRILAQTRPVGHSLSPIALGIEVMKNEGLKGFWRGNGANVVRVFPSRGILFWANDKFKHMLDTSVLASARGVKERNEREQGSSRKRTASFHAKDTKRSFRNETIRSFLAGSFAGIVACACTYPLDLARTRITSQVANVGQDVTKYVSIRGTLLSTVQREGFWALYRGMGPTMMGALPYEGIKFGCYDVLKQRLPRESFPNDVLWQLACGASAGTAAGVVMYPNDTVRRLMQVQTAKGRNRKYLHAIDCYRQVLRDHGPTRFYRGLVSYLIRVVPNAAIQFAAFEVFKTIFTERISTCSA